MDVQAILSPRLSSYLPHRFQKGLALNVAYRATYLGHHHIGVRLFPHRVDIILYGARDVRDDLHRFAQELSPALAVEHVPIHLARGEVGIAVEVLVDESLVMSEVEVGLRAVLGDEHFAVLVGAHRAGIDVDVRVEFLRGDFESARFQQPAQRRHNDALSEPGYYASRYKHILCHTSSTLSPRRSAELAKKTRRALYPLVSTDKVPLCTFLCHSKAFRRAPGKSAPAPRHRPLPVTPTRWSPEVCPSRRTPLCPRRLSRPLCAWTHGRARRTAHARIRTS